MLNVNPKKVKCKKCRDYFWVEDVKPFTWRCATCGNILYFRYGTYHQQIEDIMMSRKANEFTYSTDGKAIQAKAGDDIKQIRYNRYLYRKKNPYKII